VDISGSRTGAGEAAEKTSAGVSYYHSDGSGNVTAMMDGNQYIVARYLYDSYGRLLGKWGAQAMPTIIDKKEVQLAIAILVSQKNLEIMVPMIGSEAWLLMLVFYCQRPPALPEVADITAPESLAKAMRLIIGMLRTYRKEGRN